MVSGQLQRVKNVKKLKKPTYFETNEFTGIFQEIVNIYGVPRYKEANPGLFNIIFFPVLFGIMFGDIAHGLLLLSFTLYIFYKHQNFDVNDQTKQKLIVQFFPIRFLLLLMSIFATYSGFIYNEFASLTMDFFGTCYNTEYGYKYKDCVYPFGIDPIWYISSNNLVFLNSFKMKFAVIIGILQMNFGIILKGMNCVYFKKTVDFLFQFLPQILFLNSLFGYMIICIFIKWSQDWSNVQPPSLINRMINIPLKLGQIDDNQTLFADSLTETQYHKQILYIAVTCVILMLIPKPLITYYQYNKTVQNHENQDKHHRMDEEITHTIIETIEFILGTLSNTASYLRLWALSLAHSQLSKVFFEKTMKYPLETGNIFLILLGFYLYFGMTIGILMILDCIECILHAVRLQWVEWQSKFFYGDGILFEPFSYKKNLEKLQNE